MEHITGFLRDVEERTCDEVVPTRHGAAMMTPTLALVWQLNAIQVDDRAADPTALAAEADEVQRRLSHRKLVVHDEEHGARLAPWFRAHGWNVFRLLVMVRRRPPDRPAASGVGGEVSRRRGAAALAAFRREQTFGWQDEAVSQLAAMDERFQRAASGRDFAAPVDSPACACRLYTNGELAQIDEVGTVEALRGRGYARAAVLAAADAATDEAREPIFLLTDADEWPQSLYRRLGFDEIGAIYEFLRLPAASARP